MSHTLVTYGTSHLTEHYDPLLQNGMCQLSMCASIVVKFTSRLAGCLIASDQVSTFALPYLREFSRQVTKGLDAGLDLKVISNLFTLLIQEEACSVRIFCCIT